MGEQNNNYLLNSSSFDNYAKEYDSWYDENKEIYKLEVKAIKKYIPKSEKENEKEIGLEIGVGTGRFAGVFGIKYGLEPSKSMADIAKYRGIKIYIGVAEELPFDNNFFDYILMTTTICFLNNPIKALGEIKRVLKPNGRLIIGFIDKDSLFGRFYESKKDNSKFYKNAKFYSLNDVLNMLNKLNYKNIIYEKVKLKNNDDGSFVVVCAEI
ncbi:Methyltransferase type 11 [Methanococcus aeolicus Nankai-3]|uniref:Methyltransferase type 11 n=1 Tax=Methanococcus aeolicus (strain ATCC BAA-1280 / DSM 17508 / OCM 812 / Nankai-3) TaxID=419665 RepID=A6UVA0_META3|nr:class I SAM-dependent methyltransferase [Methanococcus aeolicus]ABR56422.1 Methyltransferase type 11 [Methanococcus aeolicus Nankai-3]